MRLLLDTHALIWWFSGDSRLPTTVRGLLADEGNTVLVSAATAWEIATKARLGKLPSSAELTSDVAGAVASQGFVGLPVTLVHAQRAGNLPALHKDPFDRMLIAQAHIEDLPVVSIERLFDSYGVNRLWR